MRSRPVIRFLGVRIYNDDALTLPSEDELMLAGSIEQAEDALILFDVAAIFAVVRRNADCSHHGGFLAPDTGADDCGSRWQLAGSSQFGKLDTHAVERPIKLGDVARAAVVGGERKDSEHFRVRAIGRADFTAHLR